MPSAPITKSCSAEKTSGEMNFDPAFPALEGFEIVAEPDPLHRQRRDQCVQQIGAACAERGHIEPAQPDIHQDRARTGPNQKIPAGTAHAATFSSRPSSFSTRVALGQSIMPAPTSRSSGSPLVDCRVNARAVERHSRRNAADSTADDADIEFTIVHLIQVYVLRTCWARSRIAFLSVQEHERNVCNGASAALSWLCLLDGFLRRCQSPKRLPLLLSLAIS